MERRKGKGVGVGGRGPFTHGEERRDQKSPGREGDKSRTGGNGLGTMVLCSHDTRAYLRRHSKSPGPTTSTWSLSHHFRYLGKARGQLVNLRQTLWKGME